MPKHPPPPPPPRKSGDIINLIKDIVKGEYSDDIKLKAIKDALE